MAASGQDSALDERLREMIGTEGLTSKYSALAAQLGVGEEAVRRAAHRLTRSGQAVASPAGRQGVRLNPPGSGGHPGARARGKALPRRAAARGRAKYCPYCGRKADTDWTYCADCGKKLPR